MAEAISSRKWHYRHTALLANTIGLICTKEMHKGSTIQTHARTAQDRNVGRTKHHVVSEPTLCAALVSRLTVHRSGQCYCLF